MKKVVIIVGSHRSNSQSNKVAHFLRKAKSFASEIVDLKELELPLWSEDVSQKEDWKKSWDNLEPSLIDADGFIFISPEYGGMASPLLKNFFLFCNKKHFAHKPALLVAVSASRGGAYPISELRSSGYKNNLICYLPEHLIIRNVATVLNEEDETKWSEEDRFIRNRIDYTLKLFTIYLNQFTILRKENDLLLDEVTFGM